MVFWVPNSAYRIPLKGVLTMAHFKIRSSSEVSVSAILASKISPGFSSSPLQGVHPAAAKRRIRLGVGRSFYRPCEISCRRTLTHVHMELKNVGASMPFITSHQITSHHIASHHITWHYITLHYVTLRYVTLHFTTLHYIKLPTAVLHCITLSHIA